MVQELSISEARKKLPSLLKAIVKDPGCSFRIQVRGETVATLSSVQEASKEGRAVRALLRLMKGTEKFRHTIDATVHSENFKDFLYGPRPSR